MSEQFDSIYWRGQGPMMIAARNTDGSPMGFEFVGDVESVEGSPSISRHPIIENVSGQRTEIDSFITEQSTDLTINFKSVKPSHLARVLQADLTTKASGSVSSVDYTGYQGKFIQLAHLKVSNVVVTGATLTTDYLVHAAAGLIEVVDGGGWTDATTKAISYDYAAQKELKANPQNQEVTLGFMGMNTANSDKRGRCTIYKATIDPAFLSLIQADTEGSLSVNCKMLVDDLRPTGDRLYNWDFED